MRFDIEEGNGDPSAEKKSSRYGFIHVPARQAIRVIMLCDQAVRYRAHWVNSQKRFLPHVAENCLCTRNEIGSTVRWCYGVQEEESRRIGLLELGASQAEIITEVALRYETLRGLTFVLRKPDQTIRGRIECSLLGGGRLPERDLPLCPDLRRMLTGLWEEAQIKKLVG